MQHIYFIYAELYHPVDITKNKYTESILSVEKKLGSSPTDLKELREFTLKEYASGLDKDVNYTLIIKNISYLGTKDND